MAMLWKRLNDHGKNWRHVDKSLIVIDYLVRNGSDRVCNQCKENIFVIETLKNFQHIEKNGQDMGRSIRQKADNLVKLLKDEELLKEAKDKAKVTRQRLMESGHAVSSLREFFWVLFFEGRDNRLRDVHNSIVKKLQKYYSPYKTMERWNNVPWSVEVSESTQPAETSLPRNRSSRTSAGRTSRTRNSNTSASTLAKFLEFFTFKIIVITVVLIVVFVGVFVVIVLLVSKGSIEEDVFTDENLEKSFTSMVVTSRRTTRVRTTVLTTTRSSTALRNQVGRKLFDKTDHILFVFPHLLVLLPTPLPTLFN